jgi:hypothetical protein
MRNAVKRTAAGAVLGGSLLVTGGLGIANAAPPNNANDQQVDLAIGNSSVLHDLNVNVAAQIANLLCGTGANATGPNATGTNGSEATANGTTANPMANPTTTNAGDITPKARQVAAGQMPTTTCDSSQGVVTISQISQNPQNEPASSPNQANATAPAQQPGGAPMTPMTPMSPASPGLQPAPPG